MSSYLTIEKIYSRYTHGAILSFILLFSFGSQCYPQTGNEPVFGKIPNKIAWFFEKLPGGSGTKVHCLLCPRSCVIANRSMGFCGVRENKNGILHTLAYGNPCAVHVDPIEKKPFFHYLPGTMSLSIATAGCNMRCLNCQNWQIAQMCPTETNNFWFTPAQIALMAKNGGCATVAYTYTEPTVFFEYMYDCSSETKKVGIRNVMHSNGYINEKPLVELCKVIDAANIDLKAFDKKVYQELMHDANMEYVLNSLKIIKSHGVWLEITYLVIPTKNDDIPTITKMCEWIKNNLGNDVPLHLSRFQPQYQLTNLPPTPVETLDKAYVAAKKAGLRYVYVGNVPGHRGEDTYCHQCGKLVVDRYSYKIVKAYINKGRCVYCGTKIPGVWGTVINAQDE